MHLAIFDLDNTLIAGDSDYLWGEFLIEQNLVSEAEYRNQNLAFLKQYETGALDIHEYLKFALKFLALHNLDTLDALRQQFVDEKIKPITLMKAHDLVKQHQEEGSHCMIITATNRFVTELIAELFGIGDLIATDPEIVNDRYTGKVAGVPSFQDGKVVRLQQWLGHNQAFSLEDSSFYSDSHNDIPLLRLVQRPVAVDPDDALRQYASEHQWETISLRD